MSKECLISSTEQLLSAWAAALDKLDLAPSRASCLLDGSSQEVFRLEAPPHKAKFQIRPALYPSRALLGWVPDQERASAIILSPHIADGLAADLRRQGLNHADLNGRLFIRTPWLLIDREPKLDDYRNPVSEPALFSGKSSRLVRLLLHRRPREWTQEELVAATGFSRGLLSRLLQTLVRNGYISRQPPARPRSPARYRLKDFDGLLDAWQAQDQWRNRVTVHQFSLLGADFLELARSVRDAFAPEALCFTQWFAAYLRHPYTTPPLVSAYVRQERLIYSFGGRKVDSGGNVWLLAPQDEEVFFDTQEVEGFRLASDIQIYLDLLQVGQRGPEQAEELRRSEGFSR